eukprot:264931-Prymnesium_polylepis.1
MLRAVPYRERCGPLSVVDVRPAFGSMGRSRLLEKGVNAELLAPGLKVLVLHVARVVLAALRSLHGLFRVLPGRRKRQRRWACWRLTCWRCWCRT